MRGLALSAILVLSGALAGILIYRTLTQLQIRSVGYGILGEQTLMVRVMGEPSVSCWVADLEETAERVRIVAGCRAALGSAPEDAVSNFFVVRLKTLLGARSVVDGLGNPAEKCSDPMCGATASEQRSVRCMSLPAPTTTRWSDGTVVAVARPWSLHLSVTT